MFSRESRRVWAGIAILTVVAGLAYYVAARPMDFRVYYYGARGVFDGTRPVYGPSSGLGWPMHYRYPPLFLLLFAPFTMLPLAWSAAVWLILKAGVLILLLRALSLANSGRRKNSGANAPEFFLRPELGYLVTFLFIAPYIIEEFRYGNAQFFVFALTAAALLISRKRPIVSAASLALAISLKVWPLFFVPYLLARQDWKVVSYTMCFVVVLTLLPAFYFGLHENVNLLEQWLAQESQTQVGESEVWFPNQSFRGVLMRYFTVIDYSKVPDSNYPQMHIAALDPALVRTLWLVVAAAVYTGFLVMAYRRRHTNGWFEHGLAFCLIALLEPFTQKYALAILLWPAVAMSGLIAKPRMRLLLYITTALVLIQPLAPGANAQRRLQVLGIDFAATVLLTSALIWTISGRRRLFQDGGKIEPSNFSSVLK